MKNGWVTKKLGEITSKIGSGATPLGGETAYKQTGISLIRSMNVHDDGFRELGLARIDNDQASRLSNVMVEPNDVLLNITGASLARCCLAPPEVMPARVNQHVSIIRPSKEKIDSAFLRYLLISKDYKDRLLNTGEGGGSTRQAITKAQLLDFDIRYPEAIPEQQRIVAILDEVFEGMATAEANAEKNLQNARALFESHLHSVLSRRGSGWAEKTIGDLCILRSGTTLPKEIEKPSGEIPYLKVADMNISENLNGVTCSSRYVNKQDVNASNLLPVGTTIFPKRGGAILTNKKRLTKRIICADLNIMGVTPRSELLPEFLFNFFVGLDFRAITNGSSIPQINNYSIEPLLISFPKSMMAQKAIVYQLKVLSAETERLASIYERKLTALEGLKKSLLYQAFTGKL